METPGNGVAVEALQRAIEQAGIPRKALASDYVGVEESQFSKLTRAAALELLDRLPDAVVVPWLARVGQARGFAVRVVEPSEVDAALLEKLDELVVLARLRHVRTRTVKVAVPLASERRRA